MTNMFNVSKNINYNLRSNKVNFDVQIQILWKEHKLFSDNVVE